MHTYELSNLKVEKAKMQEELASAVQDSSKALVAGNSAAKAAHF